MPLWVALALGLARRDTWRWPGVAAAAIILALTAVHLAYWTDLRMRAPMVPAIALIAAGRRGRGCRSAGGVGASDRDRVAEGRRAGGPEKIRKIPIF